MITDMTPQEKNIVIDYLVGPRDYNEGVSLYQRFGQNLRLKRLFITEDTATNREILFEELRKLAGLTEHEFNRLPRRAATHTPEPTVKAESRHAASDRMTDNEAALSELADSFCVSVDELVSPDFQERVLAMDENADRIEELTDELETARSKYAETPEPVRKMIRFREKYSFLNLPECPDVLKILVADLFTSYDNYKAAHSRLQVLADDEATAALADCEKVVTQYLKNREIWDELEYYRENGAILGKAAKFREMEAAENYSELSEIDLMKKLQSANVNESKHRKAVNTARENGESNERAEAALARWTATKKAIQEEVARRKKK